MKPKKIYLRPVGDIEIISGEKWWFARKTTWWDELSITKQNKAIIAFKILTPKDKYNDRIKRNRKVCFSRRNDT